ncbi:MAG: hypothetical protein ACRD0F_04990 [Acidimicrobiales bacterium]
MGELYQGDLDLGRLAVERLAASDLGGHVTIEDLHYGAVAVAQRLEETSPRSLVLVGAAARGRPPGTVERRRVHPPLLATDQVQAAVGDAVTGYVSIDLVVEVAAGLGALPSRTVAIEVEPAVTGPVEGLSEPAAAGLERAVSLVTAEVRRAPVLDLADELRPLCFDHRLDPSAALTAVQDVLAGLAVLDEKGRWGSTFARRERLRRALDAGQTSDQMDKLDWALWWSLLEELDRLIPLEILGD